MPNPLTPTTTQYGPKAALFQQLLARHMACEGLATGAILLETDPE